MVWTGELQGILVPRWVEFGVMVGILGVNAIEAGLID